MFWAKQGDSLKVVADYVTDSRKRSLKAARGDDETFCSKSREVTIDANGNAGAAGNDGVRSMHVVMSSLQHGSACRRGESSARDAET